jgi:hypothetical protein
MIPYEDSSCVFDTVDGSSICALGVLIMMMMMMMVEG